MLVKKKVVMLLGMLMAFYAPRTFAHSVIAYTETGGEIEAAKRGEAFVYLKNSDRVTKVGTDGAVIWSNEYYSYDMVDSSLKYPFKVELVRDTGDGGCMVEGWTQEDPSVTTSRPQKLLMKLNSDGTVEWLNRYEVNIALHSYTFPWISVSDMITTQDGGYMIAGSYVQDMFDNWSYLFKLDSSGNLEWQKKYYQGSSWSGITISGGGGRVAQVADGGYVLSYSSDSFAYQKLAVVLKIDATGNIQWQNKFQDPKQPTFGTFVATAQVLPTSDRGVVTVAMDSAANYVLTKFDIDTGAVLWQKGISTTGAITLTHDQDDGILISTYSTPYNIDLFDLNQNGDVLWGRRAHSSLFYPLNNFMTVTDTAGRIKIASKGQPYPFIFSLSNGDNSNGCVTTAPFALTPPAYSLNIVNSAFVAKESAICGWYCSNNDAFIARTLGESFEIVPSALIASDIKCMTNQPPVADAGSDQLLGCSGASGTVAKLYGSLSSDPDGDPLSFLWSGSFGTSTEVGPTVTLPLGVSQFVLTVTDPEGETNSDSVTVEVVDEHPPATTAVASGTTGKNNWYVSDVLVNLYASDDCAGPREIHAAVDGNETVTSGSSMKALVSLEGQHLLQYWTVDGSSNAEFPHELGIAIDKTSPAISLPGAILAEAQSSSGAVVGYVAASSDNLDLAPSLECNPASQTTFPLGLTKVLCTSADSAGNTSEGGFTITVADTTPPVVTPPADLTVQFRGKKTVVALGAASAFDTVGVSSLANDAPATFPKGVTLVTWSAVDTSGNVGTAAQKITVVTGQGYDEEDGEECDLQSKEDHDDRLQSDHGGSHDDE